MYRDSGPEALKSVGGGRIRQWRRRDGSKWTFLATPQASSEQLAREWKPYVETCIEAFGAHRCMFESDYPPGSSSCTYPVLWNTFKRLASGASKEEKAALFSETARRVYRLVI